MDTQFSNYAGSGLMGFGAATEDEFQPNRAQRRAMAKRLKAQQRKGQRAHERAQRNAQPQVEGEGS